MTSLLTAQHEDYPSSSSTATFANLEAEPKTLDEDTPLRRGHPHLWEARPHARPPILSKGELRRDIMRWSCAIFHILLVVVLIVIAVKPTQEGFIYLGRPWNAPSNDVLDPDSSADVLQYTSGKAIGWIVSLWMTVLTLTTQRMALRRQLNLNNSLTAKHDANSAWMSFGSAFLALPNFRQLGFRASVDSLLVPLLYLGGIACFHALAVNMFEARRIIENTVFQSQGILNFTGSESANMFSGSSALLTMLSLNDWTFPGLGNDGLGITYDIPVPNTNTTNMLQLNADRLHVNATYFNVTCGSLGGSVHQLTNGSREFVFGSDLSLGDSTTVFLDSSVISQNSLIIRSAPWGPGLILNKSDSKYLWPSSIIIFTTVPVFDSSNAVVPHIQVDPAMSYFPYNSSNQTSTSQLSALGCNLTVDSSNLTAHIAARGNALLHPRKQLERTNKTSAQLSSFPAVKRGIIDLGDPADALLYVWSQLPTSSVSPLYGQLQYQCMQQNNFSVCPLLYEAEQFVMESLDIFPDILLQKNSAPTIALHDLENILSRMTAIEFWAEGQGNNLKFANTIATEGSDLTSEKRFVTNWNKVSIPGNSLILTVQKYQLYATLGVAIVLLLLVLPSLIDNNNLNIDSIGILQMIWIAKQHPNPQLEALKELHDPAMDELRTAGLKVKISFGKDGHEQAIASPQILGP